MSSTAYAWRYEPTVREDMKAPALVPVRLDRAVGLSHRQAMSMIEQAQRETAYAYPSVTSWCGTVS